MGLRFTRQSCLLGSYGVHSCVPRVMFMPDQKTLEDQMKKIRYRSYRSRCCSIRC